MHNNKHQLKVLRIEGIKSDIRNPKYYRTIRKWGLTHDKFMQLWGNPQSSFWFRKK